MGEEATNELESIGPAVECEEGIVADFGFGLGNFFWGEIGQVSGDYDGGGGLAFKQVIYLPVYLGS